MRLLTTALVLLTSLPLFPQTIPTPLTERIEVNVVNVDVTVLDHEGKPVRGLTQTDFAIFEDVVPQKITNFYAVVSDHVVVNAAAPAAGEERFRRKVLVVIDNTLV